MSRQRGFTLLEILVVVIIVAILVAMAVPSLSAGNRWRELNREVDTLAARVRVAQDDAMLYGREYGIVFREDGYRFVAWDVDALRFREAAIAARWPVREFGDGVNISAAPDTNDPILVLPEPAEAGDDAEAPSPGDGGAPEPDYQPSVYVLSSGEVTPFTAVFRAEGEEQDATLRIDTLGNRVRDDAVEPGS